MAIARKDSLEAPQRFQMVLAAVLAGRTDQEIAKLVSNEQRTWSDEAIRVWRIKHADAIQEARSLYQQAQTSVAVLSAAWERDGRINMLDGMRIKVEEHLAEHGIAEIRREYRDGELQAESIRLDDRSINVWRGLLDDIAQELGHRSKATVNIDARQIIVREVSGVDTSQL